MQAAVLGNTICFTVLMFSHNYLITVLTMFVFGLLSSIRVGVGFPYCMELVCINKRTYYGTLINLTDGVITMAGAIYFWKISKDWFLFVGIGYVMTIITTVMVFYLPESPSWLV